MLRFALLGGERAPNLIRPKSDLCRVTLSLPSGHAQSALPTARPKMQTYPSSLHQSNTVPSDIVGLLHGI